MVITSITQFFFFRGNCGGSGDVASASVSKSIGCFDPRDVFLFRDGASDRAQRDEWRE